jgi:hypothetical protein
MSGLGISHFAWPPVAQRHRKIIDVAAGDAGAHLAWVRILSKLVAIPLAGLTLTYFVQEGLFSDLQK